MAKKLPDTEAATPLPFEPLRVYTREEAAQGFRVTPRTWDRWTAQGKVKGRAQINKRIRHLGADLNQLWEDHLEETA
jgi:hypothetical protein